MSRQNPQVSHFHLTDERMDRIIGLLLRTGVAIASLVVLTGFVLALMRSGHAQASYNRFVSEPVALRQIAPLLHAVGTGEPAALIQLGLLLLIATPVARVLFAAGAFLLERDWLYTAISLVIFAVLLIGFFFLH